MAPIGPTLDYTIQKTKLNINSTGCIRKIASLFGLATIQ